MKSIGNQAGGEIWVVAGTRPEVIKQIPVYLALKEILGKERVCLVTVTQHQDLLQQALQSFAVKPDIVVELLRADTTLHNLGAEILSKFGNMLVERKPAGILVQGDTTAGAMAAIAAFYNRIPVWHNEAGLRSYDLNQPYPEEANRKWISCVSALNFAPTQYAVDALRKEGASANSIHLVGNTGIDSLFWALQQKAESPVLETLQKQIHLGKKLCLLTSHRRENSGQPVEAWYRTIANFIKKNPDVFMLIPIHPNNMAVQAIEKHLHDVQANIQICHPLDYVQTAKVLEMASFAVTDSGGIQEEGATLGLPVVVCRKSSERMEAVDAGMSRLVDPNSNDLAEALVWAYQTPKRPRTQIYGDGTAGLKIAKILKEFLLSKNV